MNKSSSAHRNLVRMSAYRNNVIADYRLLCSRASEDACAPVTFVAHLEPSPARGIHQTVRRILRNLTVIFCVTTILCVSFGASAMQDEKITASNWQRHPKILQVRAIVNSIDSGIKKGSLKVSKREFEYCDSYEDTMRKMAVDSKGVVRRYENEAGSDDSMLTWRHYYDQFGRLRFVFISGGAANGAQLEHRIYFDESGKRLWEEHKYVKGPGYTWPEVWPEGQNDEARPIQKTEPAKAFAAQSPCEEKKRKR